MFWTGRIRAVMAGALFLTTGSTEGSTDPFALLRSGYERVTSTAQVPRSPQSPRDEGTISVLTYNIAGLPQVLSGSSPALNTPKIGQLVNHYGLVLVQEDFSYHGALARAATHAYRSRPAPHNQLRFPDGLNRFSSYPQEQPTRVPWVACNGYLSAASDCLAAKGFSRARLKLSAGLSVDVYNLHAEAGHTAGDIAARTAGFAQLTEYIVEHSAGRALIVAGDTNLRAHHPGDEPVLSRFMANTGVRDVCRSLGCGHEAVDRVLFRSNAEVEFRPVTWNTDDRFVDSAGRDLSDHDAIGVTLAWRRRTRPALATTSRRTTQALIR